MHSFFVAFLTSTLGAASAAAALYHASPSARSLIHIFANFIYFGTEDGPYYWNVKCMDTAFAEMVGGVCSELDAPLGFGLDIALLMTLDSKTIFGRLLKTLSHCAGHLVTFFPPFFNEATLFTFALSMAIFLACMGMAHLNSLHSRTVWEIEARGKLLLQQNNSLKNRLASANARLAMLQFKAESLPSARAPYDNDSMETKTLTPSLGLGFDAMREVLQASKKIITTLKARNAELEARPRLGAQALASAAQPPPLLVDLKPNPPVLSRSRLAIASPTPTNVSRRDAPSSTPNHLSAAAAAINLIKTTRTRIPGPLPLLSASTANKDKAATTMTMSTGHTRSPAPKYKSPLRSFSKPRLLQHSRQTPPPLVQQRRSGSVFAVGMRTPDCVFRGKVRAKVSRGTGTGTGLVFEFDSLGSGTSGSGSGKDQGKDQGEGEGKENMDMGMGMGIGPASALMGVGLGLAGIEALELDDVE